MKFCMDCMYNVWLGVDYTNIGFCLENEIYCSGDDEACSDFTEISQYEKCFLCDDIDFMNHCKQKGNCKCGFA